MHTPPNDSSEQHPYFPSGDWEGFYSYKDNRRPKGEMAMTLDFANGVISGAGSDPVGAYAWTGTYDTKAETCQLTKTYVGAHSVVYTGYADENGIWGKWKLAWTTGDFHIWPKKNGTQGEEGEVKAAINVTEVLVTGSIDRQFT
jgi:hypothetical protein